MELSVIIPAYNEANRLPRTLPTILAYLQQQTYSWEVIVVDDGSTDGTAERTRQSAPPVRLIQLAKNQGKGAAVRTGMLAAQGQWRLLCDADQSTPITELDKLWAHREQAEVIIGSRRAPGARVELAQAWWKVRLGQLGNLLIQALLVRGIQDTRCGFKLFSARTNQIFEQQRLSGWGFDDEILFLARKKSWRIVEVPVRWINDVQTKVRGRDYLTSLVEIGKIYWNNLRGHYRSNP